MLIASSIETGSSAPENTIIELSCLVTGPGKPILRIMCSDGDAAVQVSGVEESGESFSLTLKLKREHNRKLFYCQAAALDHSYIHESANSVQFDVICKFHIDI